MNLLELREQLDAVDAQLVGLYKKRMDLCAEVARCKIQTGKAVFDAAREREKLDAVAAMLSSDFDKKAVRELYQQLMTVSRRLQLGILTEHGKRYDTGFAPVEEIPREGRRAVYQGVEGAYAHIAARSYFGADADLYHVRSWRDAMDEVTRGAADYAVLPVENSSAGAVSDNFDLLSRCDNYIVAEVDVRVEHALLGVPGARPEQVQAVYSHAQALAQCADFFAEHPALEKVTVDNTALAARMVAEAGDPRCAALASEEAAQLYGLEVLARGVNRHKTNTTRFAVVSAKRIYSRQAGKTSICFEAEHRSGALYNVLGNFIFNGLNMLMIQSRPIPERNWEYRFFVDFEGRLDDPAVINALTGMQDEVRNLKILGCY